MDFARENLPEAQVPQEYQKDEYESLKNLVEKINGKNFANSEPFYKEEIQKRLEEAELAFRKFLHHIIQDEIKGSANEKKEYLRKDKRYNWIAKIYPTVFTDDYKIYLLSIKKFLRKNDTLLKPSYPFISAETLKNAVVFIDEFDATKESIQSDIIENAANAQNDYLDMMKELHSKLRSCTPAKEFYSPYEKCAEKNRRLPTLESLAKEADSIFEKYSLKFDYKTSGGYFGNARKSRGFLFFDGSFRTYLKDNFHYIRTVSDKTEQKVKIFF